MIKQFSEYLKGIGKSENTVKTYCSNISLFLKWCSDSFGEEPMKLYRANVLENGYSIHEVANQAGHSNVQTTLIYSNPTAKEMKDKANRL